MLSNLHLNAMDVFKFALIVAFITALVVTLWPMWRVSKRTRPAKTPHVIAPDAQCNIAPNSRPGGTDTTEQE